MTNNMAYSIKKRANKVTYCVFLLWACIKHPENMSTLHIKHVCLNLLKTILLYFTTITLYDKSSISIWLGV